MAGIYKEWLIWLILVYGFFQAISDNFKTLTSMSLVIKPKSSQRNFCSLFLGYGNPWNGSSCSCRLFQTPMVGKMSTPWGNPGEGGEHEVETGGAS